MAETYKGQNIVHLIGERIGDIFVEVVVVVLGFGGQQLGFMGQGPTRQAALAEAQRLARAEIDKRTSTP